MQLTYIATVRIHHGELTGAKRRSGRIARGGKRDPGTVRRPGRAGIPAWVGGQPDEARAVRVDGTNVGAAALDHAGECDLSAIRRPRWLPSESDAVGQLNDAGSVGIHQIELCLAVAIACKGDFRAVRRPRGGEVRGRMVREIGGATTGNIDHQDLAVALEGVRQYGVTGGHADEHIELLTKNIFQSCGGE